MKKIISIITVCMCFMIVNVNAASLADMTKKLMDYHKLEVTEDVSGINRLQNRRNIKNAELISAAIKNDVLVVKNGLVNEDGTDFTPLTDGIIKRYANNDSYRFVAGKKVDLLRNKNIKFNDSTVFITENSDETDLNYTDIYTCIADKDNTALFVWKSGDVVQPALYRVKLYWIEKEQMIVTEIYRKEFDLWLKESRAMFYTLDCSQISVSQEFILDNLDKYLYVFADNYGGNIVVKGVSH